MAKTTPSNNSSNPNEPQPVTFQHDPSVNTIWVDEANLALRTDIPVAMVSFLTHLPGGGKKEAVRLQVTVKHLQSIGETIRKMLEKHSELLNPAKPTDESRPAKASKPARKARPARNR